MAKGKKKESRQSVLDLAFEAYERGDAVRARALANEVLAGKRGADDEAAAAELAVTLDAEPSIEGVARNIASRTVVPPRPYVFVAAVVTAFIILVVIAVTRY